MVQQATSKPSLQLSPDLTNTIDSEVLLDDATYLDL